MKSNSFYEGIFLRRPNRFIADVLWDNHEIQVHVPNTGRCKELLTPGAELLLLEGVGLKRKTRFSLNYVKNRGVWVNLHSAKANEVVWNGLKENRISEIPMPTDIKREVSYGKSRIDLYCQSGNEEVFIEVKGVTLLQEGWLEFPDAPTLRGTKHLEELIGIKEEGHRAVVIFVSQHPLGKKFKPNWDGDPIFAQTLTRAVEHGVEVLVYSASNEPGEYTIKGKAIPYTLEEGATSEFVHQT